MKTLSFALVMFLALIGPAYATHLACPDLQTPSQISATASKEYQFGKVLSY
jgi:hypothetical protein